MKKLGKLSLVIITVLTCIALFIIFQPQYSTQGIEPDYTVKIGQLYQSFEQNESQASQKYIGKVIETSGFVIEVNKDVTGANVLLLSNTKNGDPQILCTLDSKYDNSSEGDLKIGTKVKVKGQCTGMLLEVVLKNGILLD